MRMNLTFNYTVEMPDCKLDTLMGCFVKLLPMILTDFMTKVTGVFAEYFMGLAIKPFACDCGNDEDFTWKTRRAGMTEIATVYSPVKLPQFQIRCGKCGSRIFILRKMLGLEKMEKTSEVTRGMLALLGSLTTFRVSEKIMRMFGVKLGRMRIWRCVQSVGRKMTFNLSLEEKPIGEADGTGIPIRGIKKRGKELKVFVQHKKLGGVRLAGLSIGQYDGGWGKLFAPLLENLGLFHKGFLLITDGDTSILKGVKGVRVFFQRCLWHIPHQMKYYLWRDGVRRKSKEWLKIIGALLDITAIRPLIYDKDEINAVIRAKAKRLKSLLMKLKNTGCDSSFTYLFNALPDMFTAFRNRFEGRTTSRAERVMRTANMRVNVGKWSEDGALNAMKVRLGHYYNGFDASYPRNARVARHGKR